MTCVGASIVCPMPGDHSARRRAGIGASATTRSRHGLRSVGALAALLLSPTVSSVDAADVYKCRDARGKVLYSDRPCVAKAGPGRPASARPAIFDVSQAPLQPVFLARLLALAHHGRLADVAFVEHQLAVRFERRDGAGGSAYTLAPGSSLRAMEIDYVVDKARPADGLRKSALALRIDQARACIRPDTVTAVLGEAYREFDFGPDARPDIASKLRRIVYEFDAVPAEPIALTVTFERRHEFCVDLLNLDQVGR